MCIAVKALKASRTEGGFVEGQSSRDSEATLDRKTWLGQLRFFLKNGQTRSYPYAVWVVGSNPAWPILIYLCALMLGKKPRLEPLDIPDSDILSKKRTISMEGELDFLLCD